MHTLQAQHISRPELEAAVTAIESFAENSPLRGFLMNLFDELSLGKDLHVAAGDKQLTPSQAAKILNVSRVHVYKLMDRGDLPFVCVGNDRRCTLSDVVAFERSQHAHRAKMAQNMANPDRVRDAAVEALADISS